MTYTVLARKYRPQKFADLVGQEHVTQTVGNAIASDRVAHAFLFTGARGVGKTSTARLLAKALNCEKGPTAEPCNGCDPCVEITKGTDLDVLEMDGASNNSVEDVRRLQEGLPYRPARDRLKIVIVDEVHMLSTGAFNAFLKTLEEPPAHVKFIFATTEVHKVPITIRSRCQRHDFRLIAQGVVVEHIRKILQAENVSADEAALHLVAREAGGSMRDALTVLDQLLAFAGDTLTGDAVAQVLGIAGGDQVHDVANAVVQGRPADCLRAVNGLAEAGLDVLHFSRKLNEYLRDLVVLKLVGSDGDLVTLSPDELQNAEQLTSAVDNTELERAFAGVSDLVDRVARAGNPQLTLEMGLVRLADRPRLRSLSELVAKLDALLPELADGSKPPPAGGGPAGGSGGTRRGPAQDLRPADPRFLPPEKFRTSQMSTEAKAKTKAPEPRTSDSGPLPTGHGTHDAAAPAATPGQSPPAPRHASQHPAQAASGQARTAAPADPPGADRQPTAPASANRAAAGATPMDPPQVAQAKPVTSAAGSGGPPPDGAPAVQRHASQVATSQVATSQVATGQVATSQVATGQVANEVPPAPPPVAAATGGHAQTSAEHGRSQAESAAQSAQEDPKATAARAPSAPEVRTAATAQTTVVPPPSALSAAAPAISEPPPSNGPTSSPKPAAQPLAAASRQTPGESWQRIVALLRERQPALSAILEHGIATEISAQRLVLRFPEGSFFGRQARSAAAKTAILDAATQVLGSQPALEVEFGATDGHATLAQVESEAKQARLAETKKAAMSHPAVVDAMDVFPEARGNEEVQVHSE